MEAEESKTQLWTPPEPCEEHKWLQKLIGEWTFESEAVMEPGQPPAKHKGTEVVRAIGPFWVQGDGEGEMPGGGTAQMRITLGYDPQKKRFVGTWLGSMMSHLWIYDGELDPAGRILSLQAEGPDMEDERKVARYKDVIELKSDDHRVLTSHVLDEHGKWRQFMTAHYLRKR